MRVTAWARAISLVIGYDEFCRGIGHLSDEDRQFFFGVPSFLDVATIGLHHSNGVPIGMGVIMPHCPLWSIDSLMIFVLCIGIGIAVCLAAGLGLGLLWMCWQRIHSREW